MRLLIFGFRIGLPLLSMIISASAVAIQNTEIVVSLEEPAKGGSYASISNLRGWAVAPQGIDYVEVFIDGSFAFEVPMGGARGDVGNAYPDYPNSDSSGYSLAFNYKNLEPGEHQITIRAYDNEGNYNEKTNVFLTTRFISSFIANDSKIDLSTTGNIYLPNNQSMVVSGASIEGEYWDILLSWDRATQGFEITDIAATSSSPSPPNTSSNLITSNLVAPFLGWRSGLKFELANGQIWQQDELLVQDYSSFPRPYIVIYKEEKCNSGWRAFFPEESLAPLGGACVRPLVRFQ